MTQRSQLLQACGRGSESACTVARTIAAIYASSVVTFASVKENDKHSNKLPFTGVLLVLDEPSQKAPHGSQGHRIFVGKKVAMKKLQSIVGMAVNYQPGGLDAHATRHKVGVVTRAWIEGKQVKIAGFIWHRDFPEADRELRGRNDLGMSMELSNVYVEDEKASVWDLTDFEFTGATILKKDAAAYSHTSLAAKAATGEEGNKIMSDKNKDKKKVAAARKETGGNDPALMIQAMGGQFTAALQNVMGPMVNEIKASNARNQELLEELNGRMRIADVQAAAEQDDDEDDEVVLHAAKEDDDSSDDDMEAAKEDDDDDDSDSMAAARGKKGSSDASDDSSDDDSSDDDAYQAMEDLSLEDASEEPGEVNKDASNRGSKTSITKGAPKQGEHFKGNVAKGRIHGKDMKGNQAMGGKKPFGGLNAAGVKLEGLYAASAQENRKLRKINASIVQQANKKIEKLGTRVETLQAQVERFTEQESRRSVMPVEITHLAAKAGYNLGELKASGQKVGVETVDGWFAIAASQGVRIGPQERMAMKNLMSEQGLLEDGAIDRGYGRPN